MQVKLRSGGLYRRLTDHENPNSISSHLRRRRIAYIADLIQRIHDQRRRVSIIDIGGKDAYWRLLPENFLSSRNVVITIVNLEKEGKDTLDSPRLQAT